MVPMDPLDDPPPDLEHLERISGTFGPLQQKTPFKFRDPLLLISPFDFFIVLKLF